MGDRFTEYNQYIHEVKARNKKAHLSHIAMRYAGCVVRDIETSVYDSLSIL